MNIHEFAEKHLGVPHTGSSPELGLHYLLSSNSGSILINEVHLIAHDKYVYPNSIYAGIAKEGSPVFYVPEHSVLVKKETA